ncbi:Deoxyribodipyrimidine photo-lyase [Sulfitobacter noctilucicola]|nr:FAD-binding domain-containing protein [Sulfitobacter noctilucicola]KIN66253.1 Deoxyribodipyrimidine photo-lyase [Sulfitobacter noctilucicola]
MTDALTQFPPTLTEARKRLAQFVPHAGVEYARLRNFDHGPGAHDHVSVLSPYIRARLLDETAVTRAVLAQHTTAEADKFLAEVFWRTYWKGWIQQRPTVWDQYLHDLNRLRDDVQSQAGLRARWEEACLGQTGIAPFDAWAHELVSTGYLHNHARMWFASIWIFTLQLPWQLGADFFLRHLLDGDVAVNTLSWRWVAGIQTRGKTYLAQPDNIAKFTGGRFESVTGLASEAPPIDAPEPPAIVPLQPSDPLPLPARYGILLHGEDIDLPRMLRHASEPVAIAYSETTDRHSPWTMAPHVATFRLEAARSVLPDGVTLDVLADAQAISRWAQLHRLEQIVAPYAPTGPARQALDVYEALQDGVPLSLYRRSLDSTAWPKATKGFFPFRKHIPDLIATFGQ